MKLSLKTSVCLIRLYLPKYSGHKVFPALQKFVINKLLQYGLWQKKETHKVFYYNVSTPPHVDLLLPAVRRSDIQFYAMFCVTFLF